MSYQVVVFVFCVIIWSVFAGKESINVKFLHASDISLRRNQRRFSSEFWSRVMVLGPSCELFDGWLSSDSKNTLSPASEAKGTRLCVSVKGGRASSYSPRRDLEMLRGVTRGDGPRLTGGPQLRGWRSIRSKCPPSWSFLCSMPPYVLLCAGGLHLTLVISFSLRITLNNHHPSGKGHKIG